MLFIKAQGRVSTIYFRREKTVDKIVQSKNLGKLEKEFASCNLTRVHRNCLINLHHVSAYNLVDGHLFISGLKEPIQVSRRMKPTITDLLAGSD